MTTAPQPGRDPVRIEGTGGLVLRTVTPADLELVLRLMGTPEVEAWWGRLEPEELAQEALEPPADTVSLVLERGGVVVGFVQFWEQPEARYRHAGIDLALDPAVHGAGLGTETVRLLAAYLIDVRGHHRLTIDPAANNARAIAAYRKVGFRPVGVLRGYERGADGTFHDGLLMDLLAADLVR